MFQFLVNFSKLASSFLKLEENMLNIANDSTFQKTFK